MIQGESLHLIESRAYIPEHLPGYVSSVSLAEPFLVGDCLCYVRGDHLAFIGYPLRGESGCDAIELALMRAVREFRPKRVSFVAQDIPPGIEEGIRARPDRPCREGRQQRALGTGGPTKGGRSSLRLEAKGVQVSDWYYRLGLSRIHVPAKVANMIRRASREVRVERGGTLGQQHESMIRSFLSSRPVDPGTQEIFRRVPDYVESVSSARLYSAFDGRGRLVAFDVGEFGAEGYAFYMFNFRSPDVRVPGVSDLLLHEMIVEARASGKAFVNLGLGINPGVSFFKEKWGGVRFLPYRFRLYGTKGSGILDALMGRAVW